MALLPAYHYSSLESSHDTSNEAMVTTARFRLLILEPGDATDEVSCNIEPYDLASAPDYEAISYAWGDPTDACEIICSGQRLTITKSLHSALCRFRFANQKRTLWADAACINQGDLEERSDQVAIMGKIYSQACQVLIWLGEETDDDFNAFNVMARLETILPLPPSTRMEYLELITPQFFLRITESVPSSSWYQIGCLLVKPWFQRVWIIQEVVMARTAQLYNGSKSMAWSSFASVAQRIVVYGLQSWLVGFNDTVFALKNMALMGPERSDLRRQFFTLLCNARDFKSTDPRDKLYALLGISDSMAVPYVKADYTISASDLFVQFTKQELVSGSLAHLSATNYVDDVAQVVLPTWVPDWSRRVEDVVLEAFGLSFNVGGASIPRLDFSPNNDLLIIEGKRLFCVGRLGTMRYSDLVAFSVSTSAQYDAARRSLLTIQWLLNWLDDCHKVAFGDEFLPTQETFSSGNYHQFCRALYSDVCDDTMVDRLSRYYSLLKKSLDLQRSASTLVDDDASEVLSTMLQFEEHFSPFSACKYFGSDDFGNLGWVPRRAQVGDVFCVFLGAKVPHLLRPVEDGRYELVGQCYLQGYMDGEAIGLENLAVEKFVLT